MSQERSIEDLTRELARVREALQQSQADERLLRAILDHTDDSVTIKDLDGRYLYANPAATEIAGLQAGGGVGRLDREFFPPGPYAQIRQSDLEVVRTGQSLSYEITVDSPLWGHRTHLINKFAYRDPDGLVVGLVAVIRDITDRKRMETALRESEERFKGLVDVGFEGIAIHEQGIVLEANQALADLFGYSLDEMIGLNGLELATPETRILISERLRVKDERPYEVMAVRKDGSLCAMECVGKEAPYHGKMVRVSAFRDLTERKIFEQNLVLQNERLKELDQLKSSFVGSVSHELRTPLTSIKGYAEFLEDRLAGELTVEQDAYVKQILAGTNRLERLMDDLLDFAGLESGAFMLSKQEGDLLPLVGKIVEAFLPQSQDRQVALEVAPAEDDALRVCMDSGRIEQVLINLIGNAFKFTKPGGQIRVSIARVGDVARVEVLDSGIGVANKHLPRLFERFYQADHGTRREVGGAGLGLSISKALITAHGGEIGVDSKLGVGSTFWFTLPLTAWPGDRADLERLGPHRDGQAGL